jgi:hypothetical protein
MASIRFSTLVSFGALLACGGPEIGLGGSTCNSDDDCPAGQICSESFFGGQSCSPPYQPPSYGGGGAGGAGATHGEALRCGGVPLRGLPRVVAGGQARLVEGELRWRVVAELGVEAPPVRSEDLLDARRRTRRDLDDVGLRGRTSPSSGSRLRFDLTM